MWQWHLVALESIALLNLLYRILFVFITIYALNIVFVFFLICYTCLTVVEVRVSWCCEVSYRSLILNTSMHVNFIRVMVWLLNDDYCPKQFALSLYYGEVYS